MKKIIATAPAVLFSLVALTGHAAPPARADLPGLQDFLGCGKVPADKPAVKLNLLPQTRLADLIGFMSTISCTPFMAASGVDTGRTIAMAFSGVVTTEELYRRFIAALAALDLTVRPNGKVLQIVTRGAGH